MAKYRVKKEAVPFIDEKHITKIYELKTWKDIGLSENALEKVEPVYISCGIKTSENGATLAGWGEDKAHFHFTVNFPSMKYNEYDAFNKGQILREFIDRLQEKANYFFERFLQNEEQD